MQERPDIWIKGGLISPKHCRAMGDAVWLYAYLLQEVNFKDDPDRGPAGWTQRYSHLAAAEALGVHERTVRRWFVVLEDGGYITHKRHQYDMEVEIAKYIQPAERARARREQAGKNGAERTNLSVVEPQNGHQNGQICQSERTPERTDLSVSFIRSTEQQITTEQTAVAPVGAVRPWDVIAALCLETGTDPKSLTGTDRKIRGKYAKELLAAGYSTEQVVCCYRYLRQQRWRDGPVKLATVVKEIADWNAQGQPKTPMAEGHKEQEDDEQRAKLDDINRHVYRPGQGGPTPGA